MKSVDSIKCTALLVPVSFVKLKKHFNWTEIKFTFFQVWDRLESSLKIRRCLFLFRQLKLLNRTLFDILYLKYIPNKKSQSLQGTLRKSEGG